MDLRNYQSEMIKKRTHEKLIDSVEAKKQDLPKVLSFWEKQKSFSASINQKLNEINDLMKSHISYLEASSIQQIIGFDKNSKSENLLEFFSFIANGIEILQQDIVAAFSKNDEVIGELKNIKKLFGTSKSSETLTSSYYNLAERLKWETPLSFTNFFHAFQTLFSTGDLFFSCNDSLTMITEKAQKLKQSYVIKHVEPKSNVLYCGTTLKQILDAEGRPFYQLPKTIENIIVYLYNKGCTTHGIFRETVNATIKGVEEIYHRMGVTDFEDLPPDVVANILKKFLREMKEKVFPFEASSYLLREWQKGRAEKRTTVAEKRKLVLDALKKIPPENVTLLRSILKLCSKIDSLSDVNAMTNKNLAVCLAPALMTLSEDNSTKTLDLKSGGDIIGCIEIVTFILVDYPHLYPNDVDVNVTRRSRRMSQRLVTCLVEGMNEDEQIYKGIELMKNKEGSEAKVKEEVVRPSIPENLLKDIRMNPSSLKETNSQGEIEIDGLLQEKKIDIDSALEQLKRKKENKIEVEGEIKKRERENGGNLPVVEYSIINPPPVPPRRGIVKQKPCSYAPPQQFN